MSRLSAPAARARKRINRAPSPAIAMGIPWLSVIIGSMLPTFLLIASAPVMPPLGFLFYLSWRQLRPGLLPVWAGLPLGLIDDLYSGQPLGSAVLLWSLAAIALDLVESRLPWRNFLTEWLVGSGLIVAYIVFALAIASWGHLAFLLPVIVPQLILSLLVYPLVGRLVALLDRTRLIAFREIR